MFDFERFDKLLLENKTSETELNLNQLSVIYKLLHLETGLGGINFDSFTLDDVLLAEQALYREVDYEDINDCGEEDIIFNNNHPLCVARDYSLLMRTFNNAPKHRPPSRFRFI